MCAVPVGSNAALRGAGRGGGRLRTAVTPARREQLVGRVSASFMRGCPDRQGTLARQARPWKPTDAGAVCPLLPCAYVLSGDSGKDSTAWWTFPTSQQH
jgi:hypothetical protein